jgi:hypothetical protein
MTDRILSSTKIKGSISLERWRGLLSQKDKMCFFYKDNKKRAKANSFSLGTPYCCKVM